MTAAMFFKDYLGDAIATSIGVEGRIVNPYKPCTYEDMIYSAERLELRYPGHITRSSIGESVLGKDIPLLMLGHGEKKILITASIHGTEHITTSYVLYAVEEIFREQSEDILSALKEVTVYIVPMANPDGVQKAIDTGENWRANENGVNLNKNFPTSVWSCIDTEIYRSDRANYKGDSAGSEPETKALMKLCEENDFLFNINFHVKGELVFWVDDLTGVMPGASALAKKIAASTGYAVEPMTVSVNDYGGGFENWFRQKYNRTGLCVEMTPLTNDIFPHDNKDFDELVWDKTKNLLPDIIKHANRK